MDTIIAYHAAVDAVVAFTDAPRSLLHMHVGMAIYLGCQLLLGTRRGSLVAVVVTVFLALLHEVLNRIFHGAWRWEDTTGDLVLSLFWPTMCYAVSRFRRWNWNRRTEKALIRDALRAAQVHRAHAREEAPAALSAAPLAPAVRAA